jgi:ankyrin repeat protein
MAETLDELLKSYADGNTTTFFEFDVVEINSVGVEDRTPLHVACTRDAVRDVEMLLGGGANVNAQSFGGTPLDTAVANRNLVIIRLLLAAGADPDIPAPLDGKSPLDRAREDGLTEIVSMLEEAQKIRGSTR